MLSRLLRMQGWQVETAGTVDEAIGKATAGRFDVLLCDLSLPDGDGCDLLERLLDLPVVSAASPMTAIAVTGHAYPQDIARTRSAGFAHHVVKPVDMAAVIGLINDHCSSYQN